MTNYTKIKKLDLIDVKLKPFLELLEQFDDAELRQMGIYKELKALKQQTKSALDKSKQCKHSFEAAL